MALAMRMFFTGKVDEHERKIYEQYLFFMTMDEFMPIVPKLETVLVYRPNSQFFGWQNRASNGSFSQN